MRRWTIGLAQDLAQSKGDYATLLGRQETELEREKAWRMNLEGETPPSPWAPCAPPHPRPPVRRVPWAIPGVFWVAVGGFDRRSHRRSHGVGSAGRGLSG